ncbi:hypothetical protein [Amycolatopsis sp. CA-128772]|uniref:hypothetical protein n=1 Tax=Amycolatopsis sp. CA-128772 TaxID=2073159 RepID=UPI00351AADD7
MRRGPAALLGVLALVAALTAGHLVAGFVGVNASPYLAVGNGAIDLTSVWLRDFAVRTFGTYDKLVLLSGMAVVLVLVAGLLSRRTPVPGPVVITGFGVVGLVAVYARPDLGSLALLAPAASLVTGVATFAFLRRLDVAPDASRRTVLPASAGVVAGAGVAGLGGQLLAGRRDAAASREASGGSSRPGPRR